MGLVLLQALLTFVGNTTLAIGAYRVAASNGWSLKAALPFGDDGEAAPPPEFERGVAEAAAVDGARIHRTNGRRLELGRVEAPGPCFVREARAITRVGAAWADAIARIAALARPASAKRMHTLTLWETKTLSEILPTALFGTGKNVPSVNTRCNPYSGRTALCDPSVATKHVVFLHGFGVGTFHYERQLRDLGALVDAETSDRDGHDSEDPTRARTTCVWALDFVGQGASWPCDESDDAFPYVNEADAAPEGFRYSVDTWVEQTTHFLETVSYTHLTLPTKA